MNFKKLAAGLAVALTLATGAAQGAVMSFEDDDIDFALNSNLQLRTSGALVAGDILVSVFEIPVFTIDGVNKIPGGQELTGVAAIQIQSIVGNVITFAPVAGGLNSILALGGGPAVGGGGAGGGATIAMWFNSAAAGSNLEVNRTLNNGDANCASLAACITAAANGTLVQVDGFAGDLDEFWVSITLTPGGLDIGTVAGTGNSTLVAGFNAAQSTFFNLFGQVGFINVLTGLPCVGGVGADNCIQGGLLSGTILGGQGLTNGAFAHSDFDAQKLLVPEPGTVLLLGVGLLGLAVAIRRRT